MPRLGLPHCQPLKAIDWLTGCSFGRFHLPLIPWLPDGPLLLRRPALPPWSTAILKYSEEENCVCTPGRPVESLPLPSCQFLVSVSEFQGQRALPRSTSSFSSDIAMEDQSGLTREIWQSGSPTANCLASSPVLGEGCGKESRVS